MAPHLDFIKKYFPFREFPLIPVKNSPFEINNLGYRCEGYDIEDLNPQGPYPKDTYISAMFLGCSFVWGSGVEYEEAFPTIACKLLAEKYGVPVRNWNLAIGGRGFDHSARTLLCTIDLVMPDIVFFVIPGSDRREYYRADGKQVPFSSGYASLIEKDQLHLVCELTEVTYADKEIIKHQAALISEYQDLAQVLTHFKLMEYCFTAKQAGWGFSWVPCYTNNRICDSLLTSGWMPKDRYLGMPFEPIDHVSPTDCHPAQKSHQMFGEKVAQYFQANYDSHLRHCAERVKSNLSSSSNSQQESSCQDGRSISLR